MSAKSEFVSDPEFDVMLKYLQKVADNVRDQYVVQGGFEDVAKIWQSWGRMQGALELMRALTQYKASAVKP